jgi:hypothetical protein
MFPVLPSAVLVFFILPQPQASLGCFKIKNPYPSGEGWDSFLEVPSRFELLYKVLQTSA